MHADRDAALLVNARSRSGEALFRAARQCLLANGFRLAEAHAARDPKWLFDRCRQVIAKGVRTVVVGGGDGTLSLVARHFVETPATLGVLPLGTGNALARDLGIPPGVAEACAVVAEGRAANIDLGHVEPMSGGDADYFVNVATIGLSTRIARELTDEAKRRFGRAAYLYALVRAIARVRPFHARISTEQGLLEFDALQVVIGNGRYHAGPFPLSPEAAITEGRLSVYALATTNRAAFIRLAWHLQSGRHVELPEVHSLSTTGGLLEAAPDRDVTVDGEVVFRTPLLFSVAPKALRVFCAGRV